MGWHSIIHCFLFIMFCISPISSFFPLYLSLSRMQNGFRKMTPMNMNENCLSQKSLFVTQIRVVDQPGKIKANNEDWKKVNKLVTEDRIRWTMNNLMAYETPGLDGNYPICSQKRPEITIKRLIRGRCKSGKIVSHHKTLILHA